MRSVALLLSVVVLTALGLSGCGAKGADTQATSTMSSATSTATAQPTGDKVAPADLPAVVADRTFRGDDGGTPYAEYYAPDGSLRGKSDGEAYAGSWKVVGEQLCFTYPNQGEGGGDSETDCYTVFRNGDTISWVGADGKVVVAASVAGNPDKL